jgi:hypothetical protein
MNLKDLLAIVAAVAVMTLAALSANASSTDELLWSSGFKAKRAETPAQKHQLEILPKGKIAVVQGNGKTFYVYADREHAQVYIGNRDNYSKFDGELKREPDADAIVKKVYVKGRPVEVGDFRGFGAFPE